MGRPRVDRLGLAATLWLLAAACGSRQEPGGSCPTLQTPRSYAADVAPFLAAHCVACHNSAKSGRDRFGAPADINYDGYDNARANADVGSQDVLNGRMPPSDVLIGADACVLDAWSQANFAR